MLEFRGVTKSYRVRERGLLSPVYREVKAVDDVSLTVKGKETTALLGPNGAGKSTLCKMAAGMVKPTRGKVFLDGTDVSEEIRSVSRKIGVVLGPSLVYYRIRGRQYLRFFAKVYEVSGYERRISHLSRQLGIESLLDEHIEEYSTGTKMKISMARALLHDPPLLILDEFTSGLDPLAAAQLREFIKDTGKTILLTTHNPREAETVAQTTAFVSKGRIAALDSPSNLIRSVTDRVRVNVTVRAAEGVETTLRGLAQLVHRDAALGTFELSVKETDVPEALERIARHGLASVRIEQPGLEEAYAKLAGESLHPVEKP